MATTFCAKDTGRDAHIYLNTGSVATPTWTEITEARDVSMPMTADQIEQSDRSTKFKLYSSGGIDLSVSFKMSYRNGSANFASLQSLFLTGCGAEFAIMDGPIATAGSEGVRGGFQVFSNSFDFPLSDGQTVDIELRPCYFEDGASNQTFPAWYTAP